jgi:hypothetical protein
MIEDEREKKDFSRGKEKGPKGRKRHRPHIWPSPCSGSNNPRSNKLPSGLGKRLSPLSPKPREWGEHLSKPALLSSRNEARIAWAWTKSPYQRS